MRRRSVIGLSGRLAVALVLIATIVGPGCAAADMMGTGTTASARAKGNLAEAGSQAAGEEFVLIPRAPGDTAEDLVRGHTPLTTGDPLAGGDSTSAAPLGNNTAGQVSGNDTAEIGPGSCGAGTTAPLGLYLAGEQVLLAGAKGLHSYSGGTWTALADKFPCGTAPAAIAAASASYFAAAADGIYQVASPSRTWARVAAGTRVVDLDITPDASAGMAIEETGRPWRFDGQAWASQSLELAPLMGNIRTLSATESYAIGSDGSGINVIGLWDGQKWTNVAQPDATNPAAGLAVRRDGSTALVATTRTGLYRLASGGWVAELGPSASYYLGIPSFNGSAGFTVDLGAAAGKAFAYQAATWQDAAPAPEPLETVVTLPGGDALALAADGETLYLYAGGSWKQVTAP